MPLRKAITGRPFGPNMADLIVLIGREKVLERLAKL
jgi:glutamyl-tRNA synthetase